MISATWRCAALAAFLLSLAFLAGCDNKSAERAAIRKSWEAYCAAVQGNDGQAVLALLNERSFEDAARLLHHVLNSDRDDLKRLSLLDRQQIVMIRNRATKDQIAKLDGRGLVAFVTSKGWWGPQFGFTFADLGPMKVRNTTATVTQVDPKKQPIGTELDFTLEDGAWKLDLVCFLRSVERQLKDFCDQLHMNPDEAILHFESLATGKRVSPAIWEPMR